MRGLGLAIIFSALFVVSGLSQPASRFNDLMLTSHSANYAAADLAMNDFIVDLATKKTKFKSEEIFLRYAFREAHKRFLKSYQAYVSFPEIFETGKYDCLTATALMSLVFDHFELQYEIIETNYHIFLLVNMPEGKMLVETTDMLNGVVVNELQIEERLMHYAENKVASSDADKYYYQSSFNLFQVVKPQSLSGLLYYNQAVTALNNLNYKECVGAIKQAVRNYNSPRISELATLALKSVSVSDLPDDEKRTLIKALIPYIHQSYPLAAR